MANRKVTKCVATGLNSDTKYSVRVVEECERPQASSSIGLGLAKTDALNAEAPEQVYVGASQFGACEDLRPGAKSGVYKSSSGTSVYCDNEHEGGRWSLLYTIAAQSSDFAYDSFLWEHDDMTLNDGDFSAANAKHSIANTRKFSEYMALFSDFTVGKNTWKLGPIYPPQTSVELFSKERIIASGAQETYDHPDFNSNYFSYDFGAGAYGINLHDLESLNKGQMPDYMRVR